MPESLYTIHFTSRYKKSYKRMYKRGRDMSILDNVVRKLANGERLEPKYHDHVLKENYSGRHECHLQPDWLLIYEIVGNQLILILVDTGSHADLFSL